ncbi:MAG: DUF4912 domain-containing protein [Fibrobacter sp.]|nr:DUF4912 domain-containing protein [Fibrobacter sp.]
MAIKKETEVKSKIKSAVKSVAEKTAEVVKKTRTTKKAAGEKAASKATVDTLKEAEAKAEKVVAKVSKVAKAAATKVKAVKASVKAEKTEKTEKATKTTKATTAKTAAKTTKATAKTAKATKAAAESVKAKAASAEVENASEKSADVASMAQSFDAEYLVLMQKDPNWMHAFWEVSENRIKQAKKGKRKLVLRLFDIASDLTVQRSKKRKFRDIEVPADARSWYVENPSNKSCVAVLGAVQGNNFMPIVESAPVMTFDKSAAAPASDDAFAKASLGGNTLGNFMSSGFSSQTAESWLKSLNENFGSSSESMFSGALSSAALQSNGSLSIAAPKDSVSYGKDFFLWVKTRLIVYGGTRPDAHLQVRGEDFPLNPDGTFSFEEDLPDVTKVIPVFATDKDGDFPTTIVPIVVKRTE